MRRILQIGSIGAAIIAVSGSYLLLRSPASDASATPAQPAAIATVQTTRPVRADIGQSFNTNASMEAYETVDLYPKVSGYLSEVRVDIGERVKAGELLALVSLPETEKQLARPKQRLPQSAQISHSRN